MSDRVRFRRRSLTGFRLARTFSTSPTSPDPSFARLFSTLGRRIRVSRSRRACMRELLDAVADGTVSPAAAEAELRGYATGEAGRFDAARDQRRGVPEAIFAEGKSIPQVVALAATALET